MTKGHRDMAAIDHQLRLISRDSHEILAFVDRDGHVSSARIEALVEEVEQVKTLLSTLLAENVAGA